MEVLVTNQEEANISSPTNGGQSQEARENTRPSSPGSPESPRLIAGPIKIEPPAPLNPPEAEAIFQRVERIHRDTEVMKRLGKVERQNRKIMILGSMVFMIFILTMSAFAFLMVKTGLL